MHFAASAMALVAAAASASAASVTFWTLDDITRTVYFTANPGHADIAPVTVNNQEKKKVEFDATWQGNYYAVQEGQADKPGMLGEVNFGQWGGLTFYDVSAIVDPADHGNIHQMWPLETKQPVHGCEVFPCNTVYSAPDDVQTQATHEVDLVTTLGTVGLTAEQIVAAAL